MKIFNVVHMIICCNCCVAFTWPCLVIMGPHYGGPDWPTLKLLMCLKIEI